MYVIFYKTLTCLNFLNKEAYINMSENIEKVSADTESTETASAPAETKSTKKKTKTAKKSNSTNTSKIISIDGKLKVDTDDSLRKKALVLLNGSFKGGKILTGKISGIETLEPNGPCVAIIYVDDFKVMIPAAECVDVPDSGDRDPKKYEQYVMSKRLGSEVDYIVKGIDAEHDIVAASRKDAMEKKCKEFFLEKDKAGQYIIEEGACVEARVVCTTRAGIIVEVFGVEAYIPSRELSYQRVQDATQNFSVGGRVVVKILSIERNEEEGSVAISASVKQAGPNPYEKAMKRYNVNDKYIGTVSMIDENGVFVALDGGIDVLCKYPDRGTRPPRGTTVTVRITTKNEEMNRLFGLITHVAKI